MKISNNVKILFLKKEIEDIKKDLSVLYAFKEGKQKPEIYFTSLLTFSSRDFERYFKEYPQENNIDLKEYVNERCYKDFTHKFEDWKEKVAHHKGDSLNSLIKHRKQNLVELEEYVESIDSLFTTLLVFLIEHNPYSFWNTRNKKYYQFEREFIKITFSNIESKLREPVKGV